MTMKIENKTFLIFGCNGLIGQSITKKLSREGAKIFAADIELTDSQTFKDENIEFIQLDINDENSVSRFLKKNKNLDGAVNCTYPRNKNFGKSLLEVDIENFNENVSLGLGGAFLFSKLCASYFLENKKNFSLINLSSVYGVIAPKFDVYKNTSMTMPIEYAAIKSGLIHISKYITSYINDSRFRINCISPGGILDGQDSKFLKAYKSHSFGKGMLDPEDICDAIIFLLSENSKYINGQNIIIDDGYSL